MGLFNTTKKKTRVYSNTYSNSEDLTDQDNYLMGKVVAATLDPNESVTDAVIDSFFSGPASNLERYKRTAESIEYEGVIQSTLGNSYNVDTTVIADYIRTTHDLPTDPTDELVINAATISTPELGDFAYKYLLENYTQQQIDQLVYTVELLNNFNIRIEFEDLSFVDVALPHEWDLDDLYLSSYYLYNQADYSDSLITGVLIETDTLPDTSTYTLISDTDIPEPVTLNTTVVILREFSDSTPDETETTVTPNNTSFTRNEIVKDRDTIQPESYNGRDVTLTETYYEFTNYEIIEDVSVNVEVIDHGSYTETVTTTTTTELFNIITSYRIDEQTSYSDKIRRQSMLLYKIGEGVTSLDNLVVEDITDTSSEFYPALVLRDSNQSVRDTEYYDDTKNLYKKLNGGNVEDVLQVIEDNPDVNEIDFAFLQLGFAINTSKPEELKYIYNFLLYLTNYQTNTLSEYNAWRSNAEFKMGIRNAMEAAEAAGEENITVAYRDYMISQGVSGSFAIRRSWDLISNFMVINNSFDFKTDFNFNLSYRWNYIKEDVFTGLAKSGAVAGDIFWSNTPPNGLIPLKFYSLYTFSAGLLFTEYGELEQYLYWQTDDNTYKVLTVSGLDLVNKVYGDYYTLNLLDDSINDTVPSKLIIPLHRSVFRQYGAISRNQLAIQAMNFVFNSVVITKVRWYQRAGFKIILIAVVIIIVIVITIYTLGKGTGPSVKAAAALLASVGASAATIAVLAPILGFIISMVAGFIISKLLYLALEPLVGETAARIISSITAIIVSAGMSGGFDFTAISNELLRADNLIYLTMAIAEPLVEQNYGDLASLQDSLISLKSEYDATLELIKDNTENLGLGEASNIMREILSQTILNETPDEFLARTLASSDDIIDMSHSIIDNFVDINLDLDRNIT